MTASPQYHPSATDLLDELIERIDEPGWRPFSKVAVAAAKRRIAKRGKDDDLEIPLQLANRLAAGQHSVSSALAIVDDLPGEFDPLDRDRRPDPRYRRHGVNQLAFAIEDEGGRW